MASEWIKIEHILPDKPEVFKMAEILEIDPDAVVGKLVRLWTWCDQQTVDGCALGVTDSFIDRLTHQPGFSDALRKVDWLQALSGSLAIPRFDRHNGQTAKARSESARRMAKSRVSKKPQPMQNGCCGNVAEKPQRKPQPEEEVEEEYNTDTHNAGAIHELPLGHKPEANPQVTHPTLEQVKALANSRSIPPDCAETFWNANMATGWVDGRGQPIRSWPHALSKYAASWRANAFQRSQRIQKPSTREQEHERTGIKTTAGSTIRDL